jgi:hypothetical protein
MKKVREFLTAVKTQARSVWATVRKSERSQTDPKEIFVAAVADGEDCIVR